MPRFRLPAALAAAALLVSAAAAAPSAYAAPPTGAAERQVATDERGCTEIAYVRGALRDVIRPLVPERYELVAFPPAGWPTPPAGSPDRVNLLINEVVCDVAVTRRGAHGSRQREVTTVIVSAQTETIDGQPSDGSYALLYATENTAQRKAMERLGWPVNRLSRAGEGSLTTSSGGLTEATIVLRGSGWDSRLTASTVAPLPEPKASTVVYHRDTKSGQLKLCLANEVSQVDAVYSGDLSQTPLATLTSAKPVFAGYPGWIIRGRWRSTLTAGSCPEAVG